MHGDIKTIPEYGTYPTNAVPLREAQGIAMDNEGNIFVADTGNHVVRKIDIDKKWSVVAGKLGIAGSTGDGSAASNALLNTPWGVAIDSMDTLYIADTGNNAVRMVNNYTISTFLSSWTEAGMRKSLNSPIAIAVDSMGGLYVGDTLNHRIVKRQEGKILPIYPLGFLAD